MVGQRLYSGTGEELGTILGVENDRTGAPKWICFLEGPHTPARKVRLDFVRAIMPEGVMLCGPREGYHITRLHR